MSYAIPKAANGNSGTISDGVEFYMLLPRLSLTRPPHQQVNARAERFLGGGSVEADRSLHLDPISDVVHKHALSKHSKRTSNAPESPWKPWPWT